MKHTLILTLFGCGIAACGAHGKPAAADREIRITSEGKTSVQEDKCLSIHTEKVKCTIPDRGLTIECDRLEIHRSPPPEARLVKAIATGNVVVNTRDATGKLLLAMGQMATHDAKTGETTLGGKPSPSLDMGGGIHLTAKTIILSENGVFRTRGPTRTLSGQRKDGASIRGKSGVCFCFEDRQAAKFLGKHRTAIYNSGQWSSRAK